MEVLDLCPACFERLVVPVSGLSLEEAKHTVLNAGGYEWSVMPVVDGCALAPTHTGELKDLILARKQAPPR